ncbi:GntR family transcriptional regulator [Thalassobacillus sp. CUG 92003]|uniref:GntR family transcriptional regulator n=1 Tax=Thalassobacillus sp. CUG 92003 TaxID=2736641 RepID=UPI0015E737EB|nr:GntR family transcriptional regulator [Thalassobacillus sp. CUG 92003]
MSAKNNPLYRQIAEKIKCDVINEHLKEHQALPSESKLAKMFDVSRVTVRKAIQTLIHEGALYSVHGGRTYVNETSAPPKPNRSIYKLRGYTEEMIRLKTDLLHKIVTFREETPPSHVKDELNLAKDENVYFVQLLRFFDGDPVVFEESYLPVNLFPELSERALQYSKYDYIERIGHSIQHRYSEILPGEPEKRVQKQLDMQEGLSLFELKSLSYLADGRCFEYSHVHFHPEKYTFTFVPVQGI